MASSGSFQVEDGEGEQPAARPMLTATSRSIQSKFACTKRTLLASIILLLIIFSVVLFQRLVTAGAGAQHTATLYLVRHGESTHNAASHEGQEGLLIWDAPLSEKGLKQAKSLRAITAKWGLDLALASPLRRALQTADGALGEDPGRHIVACTLARERLCESDDVGSSVIELRREFPQDTIDLTSVPDGVWWYADPSLEGTTDPEQCRAVWAKHHYEEPVEDFQARMRDLRALILHHIGSGKRTIAVFAHFWVIEEMWRITMGRKRCVANAKAAGIGITFSKDGEPAFHDMRSYDFAGELRALLSKLDVLQFYDGLVNMGYDEVDVLYEFELSEAEEIGMTAEQFERVHAAALQAKSKI